MRSRLPTNAAAYLSKRYRRLQCKRLPDLDASSFSGFPRLAIVSATGLVSQVHFPATPTNVRKYR